MIRSESVSGGPGLATVGGDDGNVGIPFTNEESMFGSGKSLADGVEVTQSVGEISGAQKVRRSAMMVDL